MGQIFYASAYDAKTKECCVMDADKFHANCFSYNGTIISIHYLLRQQPYNVMWGGHYVVLNNRIKQFTREEYLLGLSTYLTKKDFEMNTKNLKENEYYPLIEKISKYSKQWKKIDVLDKAVAYFDWDKNHSPKYDGYLVNHTKKQAVSLTDYFDRSKYLSSEEWDAAIDLIPVLAETGEGTPMVLFDGMSADSTDELAGAWCGDLLQIVDELPDAYPIIPCCFAPIWKRVEYCHEKFGVNDEGFLLKDKEGNLFEGAVMNIIGKRSSIIYNIKVELKPEENKIRFIPVKITL